MYKRQKEYDYQALIREIDAKATPEMLADICRDCCWFPIIIFQKQTITNAKMAYRDDKTGDILHKKSQLAVIKQPISPLKHA